MTSTKYFVTVRLWESGKSSLSRHDMKCFLCDALVMRNLFVDHQIVSNRVVLLGANLFVCIYWMPRHAGVQTSTDWCISTHVVSGVVLEWWQWGYSHSVSCSIQCNTWTPSSASRYGEGSPRYVWCHGRDSWCLSSCAAAGGWEKSQSPC